MSRKKKGLIIGVDPHKMSVTIEVVDTYEQLLGTGRFDTDRASSPMLEQPGKCGRTPRVSRSSQIRGSCDPPGLQATASRCRSSRPAFDPRQTGGTSRRFGRRGRSARERRSRRPSTPRLAGP